jgi:hypothetical protein
VVFGYSIKVSLDVKIKVKDSLRIRFSSKRFIEWYKQKRQSIRTAQKREVILS